MYCTLYTAFLHTCIHNSSINEQQILANLETYRRAMLLSVYLTSQLTNRSVKQFDILSSLHEHADYSNTTSSVRLSPTSFIHLLIYVLQSDQLPSYMQPMYALSAHAKPFSKNDETDGKLS